MRIYRGSDADIVLRPYMLKLSEIVSFDIQLWTKGTYTVNRSSSESGITVDKENNIVNVHLTDKETGFLDAGAINVKLMYRITDSAYPDGTYDGVITIPQEYYLITPHVYTGVTIDKVYESGYTEGYNTAIQNSVKSLNGETGDLTLKTVNGNAMLGEGNIEIKAGVESVNGETGAVSLKTINNQDITGSGNIEIKAGVESVNGETGAVIVNSLKYKQITNETKNEVYEDVKAHWSDASGYTGDYIYYYQKGKDQIIFDEVKLEGDTAFFNSATINYTSGQVHNPRMRLLCCIVRTSGDIQINENQRVLSDVNGMRYNCYNAVPNSKDAISFETDNYGDGYGIYETTDTGERDGIFCARFRGGIDGYKGNTPANIFTDGTDVFMAFDVLDYHYMYKKSGNSWAFVSKVKIGGVQSDEVSNIKVLTQAAYDELTVKDTNTLYCIKG